MTPYRIAVVDDLEAGPDVAGGEAWRDYMARERLEYELTAFASGEAFSAALEQGQRFNLVFMDIYMDGITGTSRPPRPSGPGTGSASWSFLPPARTLCARASPSTAPTTSSSR